MTEIESNVLKEGSKRKLNLLLSFILHFYLFILNMNTNNNTRPVKFISKGPGN